MAKRILTIPIFLVMVILIFFLIGVFSGESVAIYTQNSVVTDLRGVDMSQQSVRIDGDYEIYSGELLTPRDFAIGNQTPTGYVADAQYGTRRMVLLLEPGHTYAISGRSSQLAQAVYINGQLAGMVGQPGTTKETTRPGSQTFTYYFTPTEEQNEIIIQYANFNHPENEQPHSILVGYAENIQRMNLKRGFGTILVVGCLVAATIFYTGIFLLYHRRWYSLWFALSCLMIAARMLFVGDKIIYAFFPGVRWLSANAFEYLAMILLAAFFVAYIYSLLPQMLNRLSVRLFFAISAVFALLVLFSPPSVYERLIIVFQSVLVAYSIYMFIQLVRNLRTRRMGDLMVFVGVTFFLVGVVGDILLYHSVVLAGMEFEMLEPAALACVNANMLALAFELSRTEYELSLTQLREQQLEQTNGMLDRLNELKTAFMSNISHEMKTPLTVISVYSQMASESLKSGQTGDSTVADLDMVAAEAKRLSQMVTGLLDISRMQENKAQMVPINIEAVVNHTARLFQPVLKKNGNTLEVQLATKLPEVMGNADMLAQVVLNLLSNANANTANGTICVAARALPISSELENGGVELCVSDTGRGISAEMLPQVFERGTTSGGKGHGLGLHICKDIVVSHNGTIDASNNTDGPGATITLTLPAMKEEVQP